jgi:hypothetical protein
LLLDELAFLYHQLVSAIKDGFKPFVDFIGYFNALAGKFLQFAEKTLLKFRYGYLR